MRQAYERKRFNTNSLRLITVMTLILDEYRKMGFRLTVRQLYYQLVARDVIPNQEREYKRIIRLCNDARMAGEMDWDILEDRTRMFRSRSRWHSGAEILEAASASYHEDMWKDQPKRVFCIVEKDALVGVLERVCNTYDVPLLAARGYPSVTVLREFAIEQINPAGEEEQEVIVLHLGDHDPSGIDMTRDLTDRLDIFSGRHSSLVIQRIALNMDQIEELKPPENPAKETDIRFAGYAARFGTSSWELDALSPTYLEDLVKRCVEEHIDPEPWAASLRRIQKVKDRLARFAKDWKS